jgi:hypothetical protein
LDCPKISKKSYVYFVDRKALWCKNQENPSDRKSHLSTFNNYSSVSGAAAFGYLTFGSRVSDDIISNYSASSPTVLIALVGKQIFVTHLDMICK